MWITQKILILQRFFLKKTYEIIRIYQSGRTNKLLIKNQNKIWRKILQKGQVEKEL